jgi:catechol 2,3-dioxygenase-like lactoylglutathione lyase family enzyme
MGAPLAAALGQGRCGTRFDTPACDTTPIAPLFAPTGWTTVLLDHLTWQVADYQKEAAFFTALMGWKVRSDDGMQAVLDIGDWGTAVIRGGGTGAAVQSFCFGIEPWDARKIQAELVKRGLNPIVDNDGKGFESFHVKDPDGFDLQLSNGTLKKRRATPATGKLTAPAPFASTGWNTVWLDHISFTVTNYKESASFYCSLLGWKPTYDEGSQNECMIGDVGNIIIRGGNPLDPNFGRGGRGGVRGRAGGDTSGGRAGGGAPSRRARIDHISFGVQPWDTDAVKAALDSRGLRARIDTATGDDIHVSAYKSYHTSTPNGYDIQISAITRESRLTLPTAVAPKRPRK